MSIVIPLPSRVPSHAAVATLNEPGPGAATPTLDEMVTQGPALAAGAVAACAAALTTLQDAERVRAGAMESDAIETVGAARRATDARLGQGVGDAQARHLRATIVRELRVAEAISCGHVADEAAPNQTAASLKCWKQGGLRVALRRSRAPGRRTGSGIHPGLLPMCFRKSVRRKQPRPVSRENLSKIGGKSGAPGGARTHDPKIKSLVLYRLSYRREWGPDR